MVVQESKLRQENTCLIPCYRVSDISHSEGLPTGLDKTGLHSSHWRNWKDLCHYTYTPRCLVNVWLWVGDIVAVILKWGTKHIDYYVANFMSMVRLNQCEFIFIYESSIFSWSPTGASGITGPQIGRIHEVIFFIIASLLRKSQNGIDYITLYSTGRSIIIRSFSGIVNCRCHISSHRVTLFRLD
jgi:hypothetical protein